MAKTSVTKNDILSGETIFLAEDHFDAHIIELLQECMQGTGAVYTAERKEATIVLINPSSAAYRTEKDRAAALAKNPGFKITSIPYHWLTQCQLLGRKIPFDELEPPQPIFTNPNRSKGYQPLRAWVSINVPRNEGETTPEDAQGAVQSLLVRGGALMVKKRGSADLLIVDPTSNFYNVIIKEKKAKQRYDQKLAERDWVEDCFKNGKVVWITEGDVDQGEESFGEEEMSRGAGPGRPTGQPRNEYAPADDDFLVRYLAAYHSAGSWRSRKTYEMLFGRREKFPIAARHSAQSWHERFKKNAATLERRVERMIAEGMDEELTTSKEREKKNERNRAEEQAQAGPSGSASRNAPSTPKRNEAETVVTPKRAGKSSTAAKEMPAKKTLVGSDTESEPVRPTTTNIAPPSVTAGPSVAASEPATENVPVAGPSVPTQPAVNDFESLLPPAPSVSAAQRKLQGDSAIVDQSLGAAIPIESQQAPEGTESQGESQHTTSSNGHDTRLGAETQVLMSEYERIRAKAMANQHTSIDIAAPAVAEASGSNTTAAVRPASIARSPRPAEREPPAKRARHTEAVDQTEVIREVPAGRPSVPTPRSAMRAVRISEADDGSGRQRISIPVKLGFRVVGVTEESSGTEESGTEGAAGRRGIETPSPGRNRSLLREQLANSAQNSSSRRRSRLSNGSSIRRHHSPDTVYASPNIPPAIPRYPPSDGSVAPRLPRPSPPPLSNREREQRVYEGQRIAKEAAARNKAEMKRLCDKYGIRATVLHDIVDKSKSTGEVSLPWTEIERRLDDHFARQ